MKLNKILLGCAVVALSLTACKKPNASFTASKSTVEIGEQVNFTDASEGASDDHYVWSFGDGHTSTMQDPSHAYDKAGTYTVTLTVYKGKKEKASTITSTITVNGPVADFSVTTPSSAGSVIKFTNKSTSSETYVWDFGDGSSSTAVDPTHSYEASGTYKVQLTAYSPGSKSKSTKTVDVVITSSGKGDHVVNNKIVGLWYLKSQNQSITYTKTAGTNPSNPSTVSNMKSYSNTSVEFLAEGSLVTTDQNGNIANSGSFSLIDDTRISVPNPFAGGSVIFKIKTLDASSFVVEYTRTNTSYSWGSNTYTEVEVITVTYSKTK